VETFGQSLNDGLGAIKNSKELKDMHSAIKIMVEETKKMQKTNLALQEQLKKSSHEIIILKKNLKEVRTESMTDSLTNVANRKRFDTVLQEQITDASTDGSPLCLAMIDIDFFKKFNDTYGHQTGDLVLKLVATIIKGLTKGNDLAARYGGEEFALILPNTAMKNAYKLCENIRNAVSVKRMRNRLTGEEMSKITLSIGLARFRPGEPVTEFIKRADKSLYSAKNNGRNQTIMETHPQAG